MQARMKNPASVVPGAMQAIQALMTSTQKSGAPEAILHLVHLRASQINGCAPCVDGGVRHAKQSGETDERLFTVAAWREAPYFTPAERAALALAEAITRLDDRADPVPDDVWADVILWIATTNFFNRLNVATRQVAGAAW
jgi:AhpD family alkylhydroperoxidase